MRWRIERIEACGSTNDLVRERAEAGEPAGLVIVARRQTAGRGRAGRAWVSPTGGLWASILLRPARDPSAWPILGLVAASAAAEASERIAGVEARVKWPNDVLAPDGRKIAGILAESRPPAFAILGLGVNVAVEPGALPPEGTSVAAAAGRLVSIDAYLAGLLDALGRRIDGFERGEDAAILSEARTRSATLGRRVRTHDGRTGVATAIDESGHLVLIDDAGRTLTLVADDVHLERGE